ncbi:MULTISPECIES: hypothetical protein [Nocardia]|nr:MULTISPECIES: hypothetical protein [Nocardia]
MSNKYEWIETIHRECGGQGCGVCGWDKGVINVRVRLEDIA